ERLLVVLLVAWLGLTVASVAAERGPSILTVDFWISPPGFTLAAQVLFPILGRLVVAAVLRGIRDANSKNDDVRASLARFMEPENPYSGKIVSIRHAVHRELAILNEQLQRSLDKTSEIEGIVRNEVKSLEGSFAENERRMLALVQEMAR